MRLELECPQLSGAMQEAEQEVGMLCAAAASQDLAKSVRMSISVPWLLVQPETERLGP